MENIKFFEISLESMNLFSFMIGATWAFFNQGFFGKKIGVYIFGYFGGLAVWYWALYYLATHGTKV
jgi:hypothetical protein